MSGGLFALAATYRILFTVLGGYVTARLAPSKSLEHALVLGSIGSVLALASGYGTERLRSRLACNYLMLTGDEAR